MQSETVHYLVSSLVQADMKPLITASEQGHVSLVELLLANGADANLTDQVCVFAAAAMLLIYDIIMTLS